jgi:hypothetical protein
MSRNLSFLDWQFVAVSVNLEEGLCDAQGIRTARDPIAALKILP